MNSSLCCIHIFKLQFVKMVLWERWLFLVPLALSSRSNTHTFSHRYGHNSQYWKPLEQVSSSLLSSSSSSFLLLSSRNIHIRRNQWFHSVRQQIVFAYESLKFVIRNTMYQCSINSANILFAFLCYEIGRIIQTPPSQFLKYFIICVFIWYRPNHGNGYYWLILGNSLSANEKYTTRKTHLNVD